MKNWHGRTWLNPPYGKKTFEWMEKLSLHKQGIALIFARTETKGFHEQIWKKAHSIFFFLGRIYFHHEDGTRSKMNAGAPSCLVSYSPQDTKRIDRAQLREDITGKHIWIRR